MTGSGPRRKSQQMNIPDLEEDAAERKRVLNVLAQRRYRRRKREHLQKLEKSIGKEASEGDVAIANQHVPLPDDIEAVQPVSPVDFSYIPPEPLLNQWEDQRYIDSLDNDQCLRADTDFTSKGFNQSIAFQPGSLDAFDTSLSFPLPSLPSSPSWTTQTTPSQEIMSRSPHSQSEDSEQSLSFPDEIHLPMVEVNLLRASMAIARRLDLESVLWTLDADSPFHNSTALTYTHLPQNLRPGIPQLRYSHHPTFDVLPWPSVRDKLIIIFSQPEEFRPPSARSPTALIDFIYDLEDPAEGVRIWGDDPYTDENWEVGEKVFKNWWWAFDRKVINRSNELRRKRGASMLGMVKDRAVEEIE